MEHRVRIIGYGPDERVAFKRIVPEELVRMARTLAGVPDDDQALAAAYPLAEDAAREIVETRPGLVYFLEGG
jgi:hypothetical protein